MPRLRAACPCLHVQARWLNPHSWAEAVPNSRSASGMGLAPYSPRRVHNPARLWHKHGGETRPNRKARPPLDEETLEQAALTYAGRYATTRARLTAYLERKLRERGWAGPAEPPVAGAGRADGCAGLCRRSRLRRRPRRRAGPARLWREAGRARRCARPGIEEEDAAEAREDARDSAPGSRPCALPSAGGSDPSPPRKPTGTAREKALAALLRAGHPLDLARRLASRGREKSQIWTVSELLWFTILEIMVILPVAQWLIDC